MFESSAALSMRVAIVRNDSAPMFAALDFNECAPRSASSRLVASTPRTDLIHAGAGVLQEEPNHLPSELVAAPLLQAIERLRVDDGRFGHA
jgi:hypothetical protein